MEALFFVVWCEGGEAAPTRRHNDYSSAKAESMRLAHKQPGKRFTVMVAVKGFEVNDLREVTYLGTSESIDALIPF